MKEIKDYATLSEKMNQPLVLIYVMTTGCSVCHADYPRVEQLVQQYGIEAYWLLADEVQEAAGQLSLFTSPVVMIYQNGKELHRQARIIDFNALERMIQLTVES